MCNDKDPLRGLTPADRAATMNMTLELVLGSCRKKFQIGALPSILRAISEYIQECTIPHYSILNRRKGIKQKMTVHVTCDML